MISSETKTNKLQSLTPEITLAMGLGGVKLIEASAGTGKTYTIGNLYLRYVLEGKEVSSILVVTFTKAATDELRGRIHARLHETLVFLKTDSSPEDDAFLLLLLDSIRNNGQLDISIKRLQLAVRNMETTAIFTIHGFCQRALTDHAFFSQQPFEVNVATDDTEMWQNALKDWWRNNAYDLDCTKAALFTASHFTIDDFIQLQRPLRSTVATLLPATDKTLTALYQEWNKLRETIHKISKDWQENKDELTTILADSKALSRGITTYRLKDILPDDIATLDAYFRSDLWYLIPVIFGKYTSQGLHEGSIKKQKGKDPQLEHPFFATCQTVWDTYTRIKREFRVICLTEATDFASKQLEIIKQRSQTISFNDQLTRLQIALHNESGDSLAASIRDHFPVAMIDEFQDTDSVQYDIFRAIYLNKPDTSFIMIGDPKQAIYKFRGGDIFTYMCAHQDVDEFYTLDTNWRSTPGVVAAVNTLFSFRDNPFIYKQAFGFQKTRAAEKEHALLLEGGNEVTALTIWNIPAGQTRAGKNTLQSKTESGKMATDWTTQEIARLIKQGKTGKAVLNGKALKPGDIAVLVRTNFEGDDIRKALHKRGIQSVSIGRENVFGSDEFTGLQRLLKAVINYTDRFTARSALSSSLLGYKYSQIEAIIADEEQWLNWLGQLQSLNRLWQKKGFMVMFQSLLHEFDIGKSIALKIQSERRLTNLMHLAELIQQASKSHSGIDALYTWLIQSSDNPLSEETELRLESDQDLVKIITIHKSKGMEYPVVFLPFMWSCRELQTDNSLVEYHDENQKPIIHSDIGSDERAMYLARQENLAEDIRLAYVAITRAAAKVYLVWGATQKQSKCFSGDTGIGYLLHENCSRETLTKDTALPDIQRLANESEATIEWHTPDDSETVIQTLRETPPEIELANFEGNIATNWRVASFSSLTRNVHQASHGGSPRTGTDEILDFPAGSHVGLFLHYLLEYMDFSGDIPQQTIDLIDNVAVRYDINADLHTNTIIRWMETLLSTSLSTSPDHTKLTLGSLSQKQRLNEMGFDFSTSQVDISHLNKLLEQHAGMKLTPVEYEMFTGMVTGFIDLVFEYEGKYYVSDYKSNFLGGSLQDYSSEKLHQAILDRRYDLQYLLYTLALHRYLKSRILDYQYDTHIGGVYYLFLRGMRKENGAKTGVFFERPNKELIETLDNDIFTAVRRVG